MAFAFSKSMLANTVLNHLDWTLDKHGYKFVRYADDFVVLCKSREQAERVLKVVKNVIEEDLELSLSPEKTVITDFKQGFEFLGFFITSHSVKMRPKAKGNFKEKVKDVTVRCHNLDKKVIEKLNRIIRGVVNYYAKAYTSTKSQFTELDRWLRMRIRCMKYKRKWKTDNKRMKIKHIMRLGLLSCRDLCIARSV